MVYGPVRPFFKFLSFSEYVNLFQNSLKPKSAYILVIQGAEDCTFDFLLLIFLYFWREMFYRKVGVGKIIPNHIYTVYLP